MSISADSLCVQDRVCFVTPAHNEAGCVGDVVRAVREHYPYADVIVVNDGSTDNTAEIARRAGAVVISLPFNAGYGVALHTGLCWAARKQPRAVITLDSDGQHDPVEAAPLLDEVLSGRADLAIGSRYSRNGAQYKVPFLRRVGSWFFAVSTSALISSRITDPTSGFQCLGAKALKLYAGMHDFPENTPDADLIVYACRRGLRVRELPVRMYADRGPGSMHAGFKALMYAPKMLFALVGVLAARPKGFQCDSKA
jgi:glycosyltransferase involved in cell wall biosynthesis